MSAINPASFVTPGLQLPSGLGPGAFSSDLEQFSDRRQHKSLSAFPLLGVSQIPPGNFDRIWDPNRDSAATGGMTFPHIYAQPYQPHDTGARHLDPYSVDYRQAGPHLVGIHPRFTPNSYSVQEIHSPYTLAQDTSNGGARKSHALGTEWNHTFQGLSLGS